MKKTAVDRLLNNIFEYVRRQNLHNYCMPSADRSLNSKRRNIKIWTRNRIDAASSENKQTACRAICRAKQLLQEPEQVKVQRVVQPVSD
jgi:hypothetical protein